MQDLTIFPLGTVLLPGGVLPLRIFEARYNDMVRECLRNDIPFGVCRITQGSEVGQPAEHELVGCTAKIVDFDTEQPGILRIRAIGGQTFKVEQSKVDSQGLIRAKVQMGQVEADQPLPEGFSLCRQVVQQVIEQFQAKVDDAASRFEPPFEPPYLFDSSDWVSYRLTEVLPLSGESRQLMLEMSDPLERLKILQQVLLQAGSKDRSATH